jgi:hypothetical protein
VMCRYLVEGIVVELRFTSVLFRWQVRFSFFFFDLCLCVLMSSTLLTRISHNHTIVGARKSKRGKERIIQLYQISFLSIYNRNECSFKALH